MILLSWVICGCKGLFTSLWYVVFICAHPFSIGFIRKGHSLRTWSDELHALHISVETWFTLAGLCNSKASNLHAKLAILASVAREV